MKSIPEHLNAMIASVAQLHPWEHYLVVTSSEDLHNRVYAYDAQTGEVGDLLLENATPLVGKDDFDELTASNMHGGLANAIGRSYISPRHLRCH